MNASPLFDGREMVGTLPAAAIDECSAPGDCSAAVAYWVERLDFAADPDLTREYLASFGAWEPEQLADDEANRRRLLWAIAGYLREEPDYPIYLEA